MTNTDNNSGAFSRTRQQGPRFVVDRAPRTQSKTDPTVAAASFVHTRLRGSVVCTAHEIGPVSVRFGNTTLVMTDRLASLALVTVFLHFADTADRLGKPVPSGRSSAPRGLVATLIEMTGPQTFSDFTVTGPRHMPESSLTVGPFRITACDQDAAYAIATAAAEAHAIACDVHAGLLPMQHWIERHSKSRVIPVPTR